MIDIITGELLRTIDEQAEFIMRQADRINKLSALLLQHCEVTREELDSLSPEGNTPLGIAKDWRLP